jgi:flagellar biosynthesis/type III secretory pathway protein FliH
LLYIYKVRNLEPAVLVRVLDGAAGSEVAAVAMEIGMGLDEFARQEGMKKGLQQGRQEGRQEGRLETLRQLLIRHLTRRFGPVPAATVARIEAADADVLERWTDRVIDAPSREAVLAD